MAISDQAERRRELKRRWYQANREYVAQYNARYHNERFLGGLRDEVLARQGFACLDCGATQRDEHRAERLELHHLDGSATGDRGAGVNTPENLVALCAKCHRKRHMAERRVGGTPLTEGQKAGLAEGRRRKRKLSDAQVLEIRRGLALGCGVKPLGRVIGIGPNTIRAIRDGKAYRDVLGIEPEEMSCNCRP